MKEMKETKMRLDEVFELPCKLSSSRTRSRSSSSCLVRRDSGCS